MIYCKYKAKEPKKIYLLDEYKKASTGARHLTYFYDIMLIVRVEKLFIERK